MTDHIEIQTKRKLRENHRSFENSLIELSTDCQELTVAIID